MTTTLPLTYDLPVYVGATFVRQFRWKPDGITGQDFTGWTGVARLGPHAEAPTMTLTPVGGVLTLGVAGLVSLHVAADDTLDLIDADFYDIDLIDPAGTVLRFLHGHLLIVKDFKL